MNQFVILSFGVDPLNWPSFIEIGEIACSTPAWCTYGLTLKALGGTHLSEIYGSTPPPLVYTMLKLPSFEICSEKQFLQL